MNEKTQELTFGAMIVAIFGVLLLINRQTGGMFEGFFMFIFPIPMVAFSARYGWKDSLAVFVCTVLIAFFFGTFTGIFYAVSMSFIGMVYGSCIYSQRDMNRTLILIMILSAAAELLCTIALATVAGFDLNADIMAMQDAMNKVCAGRIYDLPVRFNEGLACGITNYPAIVHYAGVVHWQTSVSLPRWQLLEKYRALPFPDD